MKWLQIIIRRLRLGLAVMTGGVTGFSVELGRQVRKDISNPILVDMSLRSITFYIYIKSLSEALNIPEEKLLSMIDEAFWRGTSSEPRKESTMYM
jgi:hypothetical protein